MRLLDKYKNTAIQAKASVWYVICNVLQKCISLITVPIFTRIMTTADYGLNNVFNSWLGIITIFATLCLQGGTFNIAMIEYEDDRNRYVSAIQGLVTTITAFLLLLYFAFSESIDDITGLTPVLMIAMAIQIITNMSFGLWSGKKRFEYEYKSVVFITLLSSILTPILGVLMVLSVGEGRGEMRIYSITLVQLILFGAIYFVNIVKGKSFFNKEYWKFALSMNLALLPYYLSQMLFNSSDLLMIDWICGVEDAGLYGVAYSLGIILTFVLNSINGSFVPWKYEKIHRKEMDGISSLTNKIGFLMAVILFVLMLTTPEILRVLAAEQYFDSRWVVPPVAASIFFLYFVQQFVDIEFLLKDRLMLVLGSILAAVANIILNAICLPVFGYIAAGFTTLVSYILFVLCNYFACRHSLQVHAAGYSISDFCDMRTLVFVSAGMVVCSLLCEVLYLFDAIRYGVCVVIIIAAILKRDSIIELIKEIRS